MSSQWKYLLTALTISVFTSFCFLSVAKSSSYYSALREGESVSIFNVLVDPQQYLHKEIKTMGFLDKGYHLFPYQVDSELSRIDSMILVPLFEQARSEEVAHCTGFYVVIVGTLTQVSPLVIADVKTIHIYDDSEEGKEAYRGCYLRD